MLAFAFVFLFAASGMDDRIAVWVGAPVRDGFVDTGRGTSDSIADVKKRLAFRRYTSLLRVVEDPEQADVKVWVAGRGVGSETYGNRVDVRKMFGALQVSSYPVYANTFWVSGVLEAGEYQREIAGTYTQSFSESMGAWGECASELAGEVEAWVKANKAALLKRRKD